MSRCRIRPYTKFKRRRTASEGPRGVGSGRCADLRATAPRGLWPPDMPFVPKLRRGHYDIVTDTDTCDRHRFRVAFDDLVIMI